MVSRVIRLLIYSDFVLNFAFGLLTPIFAVFVVQNIPGGTLKVVGLSYTTYWMARVVTATPFSRFMDRTDGERDEYYFTVIGSFILSTLILFYIWASEPWHIYLIQGLTGIVNSMALPGWRILFTNHLDKGKTGLEWSFDDIAIGLSAAISAYLGAYIAAEFGFKTVFIILAVIGYAGSAILIPTRKNLKHPYRRRKKVKIPSGPEVV